MKTELDKCMAGEWYDCHDPIFITQKGKTRQLLRKKGFVVRDVRKYRYRGERSGMLLVEVMVVIFISATMYLSI